MDPYSKYNGSRLWSTLSDGIADLVANNDLKERTSRDHVVGYLCKLLSEKTYFVDLMPSDDEYESFERDDDNIGRVRVYDLSGQRHTGSDNDITDQSRVFIELTKNGIAGVGNGADTNRLRAKSVYPYSP
jgi:hypothetical protein